MAPQSHTRPPSPCHHLCPPTLQVSPAPGMSLTQTSPSLGPRELVQIPAPALTSGKLFGSLSLSFPNYKMATTSQGYERSLKEEKDGNFLLSSSSSVRNSPSPPSHPSLVKQRKHMDLWLRKTWM